MSASTRCWPASRPLLWSRPIVSSNDFRNERRVLATAASSGALLSLVAAATSVLRRFLLSSSRLFIAASRSALIRSINMSQLPTTSPTLRRHLADRSAKGHGEARVRSLHGLAAVSSAGAIRAEGGGFAPNRGLGRAPVATLRRAACPVMSGDLPSRSVSWLPTSAATVHDRPSSGPDQGLEIPTRIRRRA